MDFAKNLWTAYLDDQVIAVKQPITTVNSALNLRSIAVAWVLNDVSSPGDNFMIFDDYTVTAEAPLAPSIVGISASKTVTPGTNTYMAVLAGGSAPFSYQWKLNGKDIPGATNAFYSIPRVSVVDAGSYSVVVSNASDTATSGAIVLTVNAPPALLFAPLLSANGQFRFQLKGTSGQIYTIQISTNLSNWTQLFTVTNQTDEVQVIDSASTGATRRFYRALNGDQ